MPARVFVFANNSGTISLDAKGGELETTQSAPGVLVSNLAYSGFVSLFPLLLVLVTILGLVAAVNPAFRQDALDAVAKQVPLIGNAQYATFSANRKIRWRLTRQLDRLEDKVSDNLSQSTSARQLAEHVGLFLKGLDETERLANANQRDLARRRSLDGHRELDNLRKEIGEFLDEEGRLDVVRRERLERSWASLDWAIFGGLLATLYFDKATHLLTRYVRRTPSPGGRITIQQDYEDYRDVNGVKFPFKYSFLWLDGSFTALISDVKVNVPAIATEFPPEVYVAVP